MDAAKETAAQGVTTPGVCDKRTSAKAILFSVALKEITLPQKMSMFETLL
jgi:hypothetical protein